MSSFICSTHATKRSRSRGQPGSRTRCTRHAARVPRPGSLGARCRRRRPRVSTSTRHALAHERLGELAHVAREAALDHRRVLPGEDEHAGCSPAADPIARRAERRPARSDTQRWAMPEQPPVFFFAAMSPYSWLAAERIEELLPDARWEPCSRAACSRPRGANRGGSTSAARSGSASASAAPASTGWARSPGRAVAHERRPRGPRDDLRRRPRPAARATRWRRCGPPSARAPTSNAGGAAQVGAAGHPRAELEPPSRTRPSRRSCGRPPTGPTRWA